MEEKLMARVYEEKRRENQEARKPGRRDRVLCAD